MATNPTLKPNAKLRALQERYQVERPDALCVMEPDLCGHNHEPIDLPPGVHPIAVHDFSKPKATLLVILVRYTRRRVGGWNVVRADNGRELGWVVRVYSGGHNGSWSVHVDSSAFRGTGPDDTGDLMDRVAPRLHNSPDGSTAQSAAVDYSDSRYWATYGLLIWLAREHAPAVGFPAHWNVQPYRTRSDQHFPLDDACVCGEPVPCPRRAALIAQGR